MSLLSLYTDDDLKSHFSTKRAEQLAFLKHNLKRFNSSTENLTQTEPTQIQEEKKCIERLLEFQAWFEKQTTISEDEQLIFYRLIQMANFLSKLSMRSKLFKNGTAILKKYKEAIEQKEIVTLLEQPTTPELLAEHHILFSISPALDDLRTARPLKAISISQDKIVEAKPVVDDFHQRKIDQYKLGLKLACYLYAKPTTVQGDYGLLAETLKDSRQYIEDPTLANDKNFTNKLKKHAKSIDGKPVAWQKYLGGFLMVLGVSVLVLGLAGIPWSLGGSSLGVLAGYYIASFGTFIAGGTLVYLGRQQPDSMSAAVSQLEEKGHEAARIIAKF